MYTGHQKCHKLAPLFMESPICFILLSGIKGNYETVENESYLACI